METQYVFNLFVTISSFLAGWVLNNLYKAIKELENDLKQIPFNYVSKDDYRVDIAEVKDILKQIFNKLDNKADK